MFWIKKYNSIINRVEELEEWKASIDIVKICKKYWFNIKDEIDVHIRYYGNIEETYLWLYFKDNLLVRDRTNVSLIQWISSNQPLIDNLIKKQPKKK